MAVRRSNSKSSWLLPLLALVAAAIYFLKSKPSTVARSSPGLMQKVIGEKEIFPASKPAAASASIGKAAEVKPVIKSGVGVGAGASGNVGIGAGAMINRSAGVPLENSFGVAVAEKKVINSVPVVQSVAAENVIIGKSASIVSLRQPYVEPEPMQIDLLGRGSRNVMPMQTLRIDSVKSPCKDCL
jgi:hypothetical protein